MEVSVIVCTRNRADSLGPMLATLAGHAAVPPHEIIVVDNGSSDSTRLVLEKARTQFRVPFKVVSEPRPGQARARNLGLQSAQGEIIAFTDDDVQLPPDWLVKLVAPVQRGDCEVVVGGIRLPAHLKCDWMNAPIAGYFCGTEHFATEPMELVGANMAFSRRVLERVGGFDESLGPGALGFYDDTLFGRRLRQAGYRLQYVPEAWVEHHFDPARLTPDSIADLFCKQGRSRAYLAWHWEGYRAQGIARKLPRLFARHLLWRLQPETDGMSVERFWRIRHANEELFFCLQYWKESLRGSGSNSLAPYS